MISALQKLRNSTSRTGSVLSVGLEPDTVRDEFRLIEIINASKDICCAYKLQLAHYEALGSTGRKLLETVRSEIPADALLIIDGKRNDIGSTAERYAESLFQDLAADAVTINPLMGQDSVMPFLERADKLVFVLALTSNPGARDFLLQDGLYRRIVTKVLEWDRHHNAGFVVGATRDVQLICELRDLAPTAPFLVPGVGAQGGDLEATVRAARTTRSEGADAAPLVLHVTRGILPTAGETGDFSDIVRRKVMELNARVEAARTQAMSS